MKKKILPLILVVTFTLTFLSRNPVISYKEEVPQGYKTAVESQVKGVYSSRLPLVPFYVSVERVENEKVFYTVYYLPFGSVEMSFSAVDGYNIEKELSRI